MRKKIIIVFLLLLFISGCGGEGTIYLVDSHQDKQVQEGRAISSDHSLFSNSIKIFESYDLLKENIIDMFEGVTPRDWGENIDGVITELNTEDNVVALTFDACDGTPDSYDEELINFLIEEDVPATLFIGGQWIKENLEEFEKLADHPLFEIANHGYNHKPLSVTGEQAYHIKGTENLEEAFDEVFKNQMLIHKLTGEEPKYFRSGTAYYDDISVKMLQELGLKAVNYNVLGDAGGTFTSEQIISGFETAEAGSIFLFHMNQPHSDIATGVKEGIMILKEKGYDFVQLKDYDKFLK